MTLRRLRESRAFDNLLNASFISHGTHLDLLEPGFLDYFFSFSYDTINRAVGLTAQERCFYWLATSLGQGTLETYKIILDLALRSEVDPVKINELVYQSVGAAGFGRAYPFMLETHKALERFGVERRRDDGWHAEEGVRKARGVRIAHELHGDWARNVCTEASPNYPWLTDWITGDLYGTYYAREGMTLYERETAMFCMICALGVDEGPLEIDMRACVNVGATPARLMEITASNLPLLGYIRCTNVLTAVERMAATL